MERHVANEAAPHRRDGSPTAAAASGEGGEHLTTSSHCKPCSPSRGERVTCLIHFDQNLSVSDQNPKQTPKQTPKQNLKRVTNSLRF